MTLPLRIHILRAFLRHKARVLSVRQILHHLQKTQLRDLSNFDPILVALESERILEYIPTTDSYRVLIDPLMLREMCKAAPKDLQPPSQRITKQRAIVVVCPHCGETQTYKPRRQQKRQRKKCRSCGRMFSCRSTIKTTLDKMYASPPQNSKGGSDDLTDNILNFLQSLPDHISAVTITDIIAGVQEHSYYKVYRRLKKLVADKKLIESGGKPKYYQLTKQKRQIYDLGEIEWPQRLDVHDVRFKFAIESFPHDWKYLKEFFRPWTMVGWTGRIMEYRDYIIKVTTKSAIVMFKEGVRFFTHDLQEVEQDILKEFQLPLTFLRSLGFELSADYTISGLDYAIPDLPLETGSNFHILDNEKILLRKDNSPHHHGHLETDDRGVAQTILDVVKQYDAVTASIQSQNKTLEELTGLSSLFSERTAELDAHLKLHDDQIFVLQEQLQHTEANISEILKVTGGLSSAVEMLTVILKDRASSDFFGVN